MHHVIGHTSRQVRTRQGCWSVSVGALVPRAAALALGYMSYLEGKTRNDEACWHYQEIP